MNIKPAFGRTYSTKDEVLNAWNDNKDFKIWGGPYLSKTTWKKYGSILDSITYCYNNLTVPIQIGILM